MELDLDKKEQVEKILLTPIVCHKNIDGIFQRESMIYTGQQYYNSADEDMSDFAVGFYEIIYKDFLNASNGRVLGDDGRFLDPNFAGDTMNSFKSILNVYNRAHPENAKNEPHSCKWEDYWADYFFAFHCLANFWLLPMDIGRTSAKKNRYDSVEIFLKILKEQYEGQYIFEHDKKDDSYFAQFENYESFCKGHFGKVITACDKAASYYHSNKDCESAKKLIQQAKMRIKERAHFISHEHKYHSCLWDYFNGLGLCN